MSWQANAAVSELDELVVVELLALAASVLLETLLEQALHVRLRALGVGARVEKGALRLVEELGRREVKGLPRGVFQLLQQLVLFLRRPPGGPSHPGVAQNVRPELPSRPLHHPAGQNGGLWSRFLVQLPLQAHLGPAQSRTARKAQALLPARTVARRSPRRLHRNAALLAVDEVLVLPHDLLQLVVGLLGDAEGVEAGDAVVRGAAGQEGDLVGRGGGLLPGLPLPPARLALVRLRPEICIKLFF